MYTFIELQLKKLHSYQNLKEFQTSSKVLILFHE